MTGTPMDDVWQLCEQWDRQYNDRIAPPTGWAERIAKAADARRQGSLARGGKPQVFATRSRP